MKNKSILILGSAIIVVMVIAGFKLANSPKTISVEPVPAPSQTTKLPEPSKAIEPVKPLESASDRALATAKALEAAKATFDAQTLEATKTTEVALPAQLSVEDYFYLIPSNYLGMEIGDSKEERKSSIKTLDLKNDYISMTGSDWEGGGEFAVFRSKDGPDLIAVSNSACGPICDQNFYLLRYQDTKWSDVTAKMLPSIDKNTAKDLLIAELKEKGQYDAQEFSFASMIQIPQIAVTMKYYDQYSGIVLYEIKWDKDHFNLQKCDKASSCYSENIAN